MSKIAIPETFKLLGTDWRVRQDKDEFLNDLGAFGSTQIERQEICIRSDLPPTFRRQVFFHELAHAILEMANQTDLSKDEATVELMGHMLYQFVDTKRGNIA